MSNKNKATLRVKFSFREGSEFSPAVRRKLESVVHTFVAQLSDYFASRDVAFPDGVELNFPDGSNQTFFRRKSKILTKRQKEILKESGVRMSADFLESIARSEDDRANIAKWKQDYDQAFFGKTRDSEKKREAMEFLRRWRNAELYDRESVGAEAMSLIAPMRIVFLTPVLNALNASDAEFFEGLAQAMRILNHRIYNSKNPNIASGDTYIDKWLLEYKLTLPRGRTNLTMRELHELVSRFWPISVRKLRQKCKEFGIHLKADARGKAAKRYGTITGTNLQ